jgi:hypothetical protein
LGVDAVAFGVALIIGLHRGPILGVIAYTLLPAWLTELRAE